MLFVYQALAFGATFFFFFSIVNILFLTLANEFAQGNIRPELLVAEEELQARLAEPLWRRTSLTTSPH